MYLILSLRLPRVAAVCACALLPSIPALSVRSVTPATNSANAGAGGAAAFIPPTREREQNDSNDSEEILANPQALANAEGQTPSGKPSPSRPAHPCFDTLTSLALEKRKIAPVFKV